jgi:hypothetical protein
MLKCSALLVAPRYRIYVGVLEALEPRSVCCDRRSSYRCTSGGLVEDVDRNVNAPHLNQYKGNMVIFVIEAGSHAKNFSIRSSLKP